MVELTVAHLVAQKVVEMVVKMAVMSDAVMD